VSPGPVLLPEKYTKPEVIQAAAMISSKETLWLSCIIEVLKI
jgi:hypothetical protein